MSRIKLLLFVVASFSFFLVGSLFFTSDTFAQSCGITCGARERTCVDTSTGGDCREGFPNCVCSDVCYASHTLACGTEGPAATCELTGDDAGLQISCGVLSANCGPTCGSSGGPTAGPVGCGAGVDSCGGGCCFDSAPVCMSGGCCPAGTVTTCTPPGGGDPYCSSTTCPAPSDCEYGECSGSGTLPSGDTSGFYSCDGTCWQWANCPAGQTFNGTECVESPIPTSGGGGGGGGGTTPAPTVNPCAGGGTPCNGSCCGAGEACTGAPLACYEIVPPACGTPGAITIYTYSSGGSLMTGIWVGCSGESGGTQQQSTATFYSNTVGLWGSASVTCGAEGGFEPSSQTISFPPCDSVTEAYFCEGGCGVLTPTPSPSPIPTYTASGTVFHDEDGDGVRFPGEPFSDINFNGERDTDPCIIWFIICIVSGPEPYTDSNGNGVWEAPEPGVSGVQIRRDGPGTIGQRTSTATGSNGNYSLSNVPAGLYQFTAINVPSQYSVSNDPNPVIISSAVASNSGKDFALATTIGCPTDVTNTVGGGVYFDSANNLCSSGLTEAENVTLQLINDVGGVVTTDITDSGGFYSLDDATGCQDRHIITVGETIKAVRVDGSATWSTTGFTGSDYGAFDMIPQSRTVSFCLEDIRSWFQVTTGDVRFPTLINPIPSGLYGATNSLYPGIYISSLTNIYMPTVSQLNWKVGDEYDFNRNFASGKGSMAYDFYEARASERGIPINSLASFSNAALGSMPSGVYKITGDTTISGATVNFGDPANRGKHIVLLVDGDVTIATEVTIPSGQGTLFVLSAKGNITIGENVGTTTLSSSTPNLAGFYTSQGDITLATKQDCPAGNPDERLNISGALIANSLHPFSVSGTGEIVNNRSLCAADATNPALFVATRPDFLTQLTDFYKTVYKTYREIEP